MTSTTTAPPGQQRAERAAPPAARARRAVRPEAAVWTLTVILAAGAGLLAWFPLRDLGPVIDHPYIAWWWIALVAAATQLAPINFQFGRQTRTTTLTTLPLVVGLFFVRPDFLVLTMVLSATVLAFVVRQPTMKAAFNIAQCAFTVAVGVLLFRALLPSGHMIGPITWGPALAAAIVIDALAVLLISVAIAIFERAWKPRESLVPFTFTVGVALLTGCLGLVGVAALVTNRATAWMLLAFFGLVVVAFRVYDRLLGKQAAYGKLAKFTREMAPVAAQPSDLAPALATVRQVLFAERLELSVVDAESATVLSVGTDGSVHELMTTTALLDEPVRQVLCGGPAALRGRPRSWGPLRRQVDGSASDLMAVPIGGPDRPVGVLQAMHRSGTVRGFDRGDLELCQAIADQLGTALEKGRMVADLQHAATHDTLTDLPNLGQLRLALVEALARRRPMTGDGVLVLAIDVHQLATVNDTVGHEAGDELLVEVGRRLSAAATTGATIGRIGGDKFAFVLPATADGELSRLAALALKSRVEGPVRAGTFAAEIRLAVGVARAPEHGLDATTLLRRAELAMVSAKETATGSAEWEPSLESDGGRRLRMISGLRDTLSQGDIELAYQPKIALGSGRVTGMEALARWTHPELGPISPTDFVPVAEAAGLIAALTGNVLRKALAECKAWHDEGWPVGVAVNLSARSLTDATLVGQIAAMLAANRVAPHWLTLEITESTVVDNTGRALQALRQLRALGVRLAIDDFGTGYSSLTYLKGLPVHEVKIDKAFVDDIVTDRADRAVVGAVVTLAKTLRLTTVAEGVEQPAQAMVLESLGLDEVQGFFYGQPMPPGAAQDWLHARPAR